MNKPKAILFDLDDTLLAFTPASVKAWRKCCDDFVLDNGVDFTGSELLDSINNVRKWYWSDPERNKKGRENMKNARREVFTYALERFGFSDTEKINCTADSYTRLQEELWSLFEGTEEALINLKKAGIRLAVVTNGTAEVQRGKLRRFNIYDYFEYVVIDSEVGASKPDRVIFDYALNKLQLDSSEVWMIGDNLNWDVKGAQDCGIFAVWHDYEGRGLPQDTEIKPDLIINSICELI